MSNLDQRHSLVKSKGLLRSSALVSIMTFLSRITGLIRDIVIANYFGSTAAADTFFVAFKIPNFLRRLFAEGAFSQAFVPVLSEYRAIKSAVEIKLLISAVSGTLACILLLITIIFVPLSPFLIWIFSPGFHTSPAKLALAGELLRVTFPYLLFISLTGLAGGILNSYQRFLVPAITPIILNISLICSALYLTCFFKQPAFALAWGVFIAGILQLLVQLPFLFKLKLLVMPKWGYNNLGVQRILKLMIPALLSVSVSQISLLLDTVLASFLPSGSISWLYYSDRLSELPLGVFGIAIATVILPSLSRTHIEHSKQQFSQTLDWALRMVLLIGIPAGLALFVLAKPLLITLFQYGKMTDRDIIMSAMSLRAYSIGVVAFMLVKVLAPGYFACQDMKTPVRIAIQSIAANMILNLILMFPLKHAGLALATTLSAFMNAGLLYYGLQKKRIFMPSAGWTQYTLRLLIANIIMVSGLLWIQRPMSTWLLWTAHMRIIHAAFAVLFGFTLYVLTLLLAGVRIKNFHH